MVAFGHFCPSLEMKYKLWECRMVKRGIVITDLSSISHTASFTNSGSKVKINKFTSAQSFLKLFSRWSVGVEQSAAEN